MAKFWKHVFICVNEREATDERGCCSARGSGDVAEAFKERLHAAGLKRIVRANKAGCLDQCARGPVVVVYPEGTWYGGVRPGDVDEIVQQHILGGRPVARLLIDPSELTGKAFDGPGSVGPRQLP